MGYVLMTRQVHLLSLRLLSGYLQPRATDEPIARQPPIRSDCRAPYALS
jgi:hypothetical protein